MHRVFLVVAILLAFLFPLASPTRAMEADLLLELRPEGECLGPVKIQFAGPEGEVNSLYLQGRLAGYAWRVGVVPVDWGPSPGEDLLFSGQHGLLSLWAITAYRGFEILPALHYENFYAHLTPSNGSSRWLIGRRYTFGGRTWQAGFTETALLSGDFSPYYFIPYPFFPLSVAKVFLSACGVGDPKDANLLYGLDLKWDPGRGTIYAAFLVDEAPLTSAWQGPWRLGLQLGGEKKEVFARPGLTLWAEYTAISCYIFIYHEGYARGDYRDAEDEPLGHSLGPDADLLRLRVTQEKEGYSFWGEVFRERHGEGGDARWEPTRGRVLAFLTGTVETALGGRVGLLLRPGRENRLELTFSVAHIHNSDHLPGKEGWRSRVGLNLSLAL